MNQDDSKTSSKGLYLPKAYHNRLIKACMQFGLINEGDRILVGLSGGKDSAFLLYALKGLQLYGGIAFEVGAVTVDVGFETPLPEEDITQFCEKLGVRHTFIRTRAYDTMKQRSGDSPCAWCSYFRRATINDFAGREGYNKVAYAHHMDDAMETLLMNMFYSGREGTFLPLTKLDRSGIEVIRPLIYFSEKEIAKSMKFIDFSPIPSPCPFSSETARADTKRLIRQLAQGNKMVRNNLEAVVKARLLASAVSGKPPKISGKGRLRALKGTTSGF